MPLAVDLVTIGAPQEDTARAFYEAVLPDAALASPEAGVLAAGLGADPAGSGFRGHVLSAVVERPAEVRALLEIAVAAGASVVRPPRKRIFGEFTAVFRAPDGSVWKLAASGKRDSGPVTGVPKPAEIAVYLGVARPKATAAFYRALGMVVDHDYGDTFTDFTVTGGRWRLGLLPRAALAKDVGVDPHGTGFPALVLTHTAASRADVDTLLATAASSGGQITAPAAESDRGDYAGHFTDPDGTRWTTSCGF